MMTVSRSTPLWITAIVAIGFVLFALRDTLAPFALAFTLWLAIDSLAHALKRRVAFLPYWLALAFSLALILGAGFVIIAVLARNITDVADSAGLAQQRIELIGREVKRALGIPGPAWTFRGIMAQIGPNVVLGQLAQAVQALAGSTVLIMIYLLFMFPAASIFSKKMDYIFPEKEMRSRAALVLSSIRVSIERYFLVQTLVSVVITVLSYFTLTAIGLDNALFWSFMIFFLNYIPTIGSIVAVILPTLFALLQFNTWEPVWAVALGLHLWQFGIGTFIQPRMTGASLNLSTVVVVLSLAIWGSLWGIAGVFLAAPLTVILMIVFDQFASTRWIAILLSADGKPTLVSIADPNAPPLAEKKSKRKALEAQSAR